MLTEQIAKIALLGAEWVLYLLVALSVASIAVMIERWLNFRRHKQQLSDLEHMVEEVVGGGDANTFVESCLAAAGDEPNFEKRLLCRLAKVVKRRGALPAGLVESMAGEYRESLEKNVSFLGTLGSNAPFIGLLGTVIGIIKAFGALSVNIQGGANVVMHDISEALVATAMGLAVAIPAVVAYNLSIRGADRAVSRFNSLAQTLAASLTKDA